MTAFADSQVVYRDLNGPWGSFRLIVGGKDVTSFRGAPSRIGGYELQEPYGYGPATFSFPQITNLEVDAWGTGDLSWFDQGKPVNLIQVDADGARVRTVWRGFISRPNPSSTGTNIECDGHASGRLALRDRQPRPFRFVKDIGVWVSDAFTQAHLNLYPYLGATTGIDYDAQTFSGDLLSYVDELLANATTASGTQWTVMPRAAGGYQMVQKNRTTVNFTVFNGSAGVNIDDLARDLHEEPTTFYGSGIDADGQKWYNGKFPGLVQGPPAPYPFNDGRTFGIGTSDADTDTGAGISDLRSKLSGMAYLDRADAEDLVYDDDIHDAVQDLQDDAGLSQTGSVNRATWDALYDLEDTGLALGAAYAAPLAQKSAVRAFNRTSNGSLSTRNPNFDSALIAVDRTVDFGSGVPKSRAKTWAKRELARLQSGKNWVGTLTLTTDVAAGSHVHGTTPTLLSRLDLNAGMNVLVRNFDGDTLFHVAGVSVRATDDPSQPIEVACAIDTKARDLLTLGQIVERNRQSRLSPARQFLREHRGTDVNHGIVSWSEVGGQVFTSVHCPGGQWTVFPVIAGQSGTVNRIRIKVTGSECEFAAAVFGKKITRGALRRIVAHPLSVSGWANDDPGEHLDRGWVMLGAWGDKDQPAGYSPKVKTDKGAPVTGVLLDSASFPYYTFGQPVLYVAVHPSKTCTIRPQRVMWPSIEGGL